MSWKNCSNVVIYLSAAYKWLMFWFHNWTGEFEFNFKVGCIIIMQLANCSFDILCIFILSIYFGSMLIYEFSYCKCIILLKGFETSIIYFRQHRITWIFLSILFTEAMLLLNHRHYSWVSKFHPCGLFLAPDRVKAGNFILTLNSW